MLQSIDNQKESDWDQNAPVNYNYYGVGNTKIYIEKMCNFYSNLGLKTTVIRHSNVYGPNDKFDLDKSHVLGQLLRLKSQKEIRKLKFGGLERLREILFI